MTATADKAATDRAAKLDVDAATIRAKLQDMKPTKETNSLGEALGRLLPWLSAATAATFQQGLVSASLATLLFRAARGKRYFVKKVAPALRAHTAGQLCPQFLRYVTETRLALHKLRPCRSQS